MNLSGKICIMKYCIHVVIILVGILCIIYEKKIKKFINRICKTERYSKQNNTETTSSSTMPAWLNAVNLYRVAIVLLVILISVLLFQTSDSRNNIEKKNKKIVKLDESIANLNMLINEKDGAIQGEQNKWKNISAKLNNCRKELKKKTN